MQACAQIFTVAEFNFLSRDGFGPGLLGFLMGIFAGTVGMFANALNDEANALSEAEKGWTPGTAGNLMFALASTIPLLGLLLAVDLATTSSRCDLLMDELNNAGIRNGPEQHLTIDWLEIRLRRLNSGQGL